MEYNLKVKTGSSWVTLPDPDEKGGIVESFEAIWSSDTGRTTKGVMKGTLIATKKKISLKWSKGLTPAQAQTIKNNIVGHGFVKISYKDSLNVQTEYSGYFGTPSFTNFRFNGVHYVTDCTVDFIEQ